VSEPALRENVLEVQRLDDLLARKAKLPPPSGRSPAQRGGGGGADENGAAAASPERQAAAATALARKASKTAFERAAQDDARAEALLAAAGLAGDNGGDAASTVSGGSSFEPYPMREEYDAVSDAVDAKLRELYGAHGAPPRPNAPHRLAREMRRRAGPPSHLLTPDGLQLGGPTLEQAREFLHPRVVTLHADTSEYLDATREERAAAERLTEVRERLDALRATPSDAPFATEAEAQQLAELLASVRAAAEERAKEQQQAAK